MMTSLDRAILFRLVLVNLRIRKVGSNMSYKDLEIWYYKRYLLDKGLK